MSSSNVAVLTDKMGRPFDLVCSSFFLFALLYSCQTCRVVGRNATQPAPVDIGVIVDLDTVVGKRCLTSIAIAVEDFYAEHGHYKTRAVLHIRDSDRDVIGAASAAVDLMKNVQVQSIIGPMTSSQADFVVDLGNKAQVPILSYGATSPCLSPADTPYFVRTTFSDSSQVPTFAAMMRHFGWREVVAIYEESEYGRGLLPYLVDALQDVDAKVSYRSVLPTSATDDQIDEELYKLMTMQTRVFIVHMFPALASRLFQRANQLGAMSPGYAWMITDGIADVLHHLNATTIDAMEGVIGVRPYVRSTPEIINFSARFIDRFERNYPGIRAAEPSVFQLWAYDTVWAVAMAVEKAHLDRRSIQIPQDFTNNSSTDLVRIGTDRTGPRLLEAIRTNRFKGLTGEFNVVDGQLQSSVFEIVNIVTKSWRNIGFWSPENGLSRKLKPSGEYSVGLKKSVIWPGDSTEVPKGWEVPTSGKKLRIGVPVKHESNQFVNIDRDRTTNRSEITGFCIDVFEAVLQMLPYSVSHEYIPFGESALSYDNLVYQVYIKNFDAVVGDTTIIANRSQYVDFTLPYTESGVSMVVPVMEDSRKNAWIFLKPLSAGLWVGSLAFFFFTAFVVWVIEHRDNDEFKGTLSEQIGTAFYFTFSTLVFAQKENIKSNLTRFLVIIWVFVVLILTSSYTASLTSMLTVQQLQPKVRDLYELRRSGAYVGYQEGSFVKGLLIRMNFPEHKLRGYRIVDYAEALIKGSANGGVDAMFDEIPYLKIFLSENCDGFTMVGPTYKTDGFGFVFPRGSPLAPDVSRAILNVTEGDKMTLIEDKWFGTTNCSNQAGNFSSSSLSFQSFKGLFLITGAVSALSLLIFILTFSYKERDQLITAASLEKTFSRKIIAMYRYYHDSSSSTDHSDPKLMRRNAETAAAGALSSSVSCRSLESLFNNSDFNSPSSIRISQDA